MIETLLPIATPVARKNVSAPPSRKTGRHSVFTVQFYRKSSGKEKTPLGEGPEAGGMIPDRRKGRNRGQGFSRR
jgi:hypothetical protein